MSYNLPNSCRAKKLHPQDSLKHLVFLANNCSIGPNPECHNVLSASGSEWRPRVGERDRSSRRALTIGLSDCPPRHAHRQLSRATSRRGNAIAEQRPCRIWEGERWVGECGARRMFFDELSFTFGFVRGTDAVKRAKAPRPANKERPPHYAMRFAAHRPGAFTVSDRVGCWRYWLQARHARECTHQ